MHDLSLWQLLGVWVGVTLVLAQAAILAVVAAGAAWVLWSVVA